MLTPLSTISLEEKQILLQLTFDSWGWVPKHFDKNHHGGILLDKKQKAQIISKDRTFRGHLVHLFAPGQNQTQTLHKIV